MEAQGADRRETRTGAALLVDCLLAHEVPLWTCVPGESFLAVLDALYDVQHQSGGRSGRLITCRHEAAAANMAEATGKLTGRAAVCLVTRGPGASHASIALHTAYQDGTPLVLVVGQVARAHLGRDAFQEMDYSNVFGSSTKSVETVFDAGDIPDVVARSLQLAHADRPGPVVLVLPEDVLSEPATGTVRVAVATAAPDLLAEDRRRLREALAAAERPALIVGGPGWTQAIGNQVARFGRENAVPIATAFRWQDAVDNADPSFAGYLGLGCNPALRRRLEDTDLLVAFGPRLDDPTTDGFRLLEAPGRRIVLSPDPAELDRRPHPDLAIHAGLASAAAGLGSFALPPSTARDQWFAAAGEDQRRFRRAPAPPAGPDLAAIVEHVRTSLPDDAIVTNGAGNYTIWLQRFFTYRRFGTQLAPRNGAMGYGVPAGLAAAALHPDRRVVTFAGDGCFLMSGQELATAVQYDLRVIVIVVNNNRFGTIRMHQERAYPGRVIATDLRNPDFAAYARAFGALGLTVTTTAEFAPAFSEALAGDGPALIEVRTDPDRLTPAG